MSVTKHTVINICMLATCLTTCLILFSMDNNNNRHLNKIPKIKIPVNLYPKSFKLFNFDFKYLINNKVCEDKSDILAVIIVTSNYGNVETRSAMRRSISAKNLKELKLRRVFLLADGTTRSKFGISQKAISHENQRFGDLVQGNFRESYKNLTYKHIMGLQWASKYCKHAKFIIKMDDDIVFNVYKIVPLLSSLKLSENISIAGYVLRGMIPIREPANKWYVTKEEYSMSLYPAFVSGWFYITTPQNASRLVEKSKSTPYFWVDDVYVTGILAKQLGMKHLSLDKNYAVHSEYMDCCVKDVLVHNFSCDYLIGPNGGDNSMFFVFNKVMLKCKLGKCVPRPAGKELNNTCVTAKKVNIGRGKALVESFRLF